MQRRPAQTAVIARMLAAQFLLNCREAFTLEEMREIKRINATAPYAGPHGPCATHDFCDANDLMAGAMNRLGLVAPHDTDDDDQNKKACELWNAAWALAKPALTAKRADRVNCYGIERPRQCNPRFAWAVGRYDAFGAWAPLNLQGRAWWGGDAYPLFDSAAEALALVAKLEADDATPA